MAVRKAQRPTDRRQGQTACDSCDPIDNPSQCRLDSQSERRFANQDILDLHAGQNVSANQTRTRLVFMPRVDQPVDRLEHHDPTRDRDQPDRQAGCRRANEQPRAPKGMRQMSVPHRFFTIDGMRPRARTRTGARSAGVASAVKMAAVASRSCGFDPASS